MVIDNVNELNFPKCFLSGLKPSVFLSGFGDFGRPIAYHRRPERGLSII